MKVSYQLTLVLSLGLTLGFASCDKKGGTEDAPADSLPTAEEYKKQIGDFSTLQLRSNLPYCGYDNQNQHFYILEYKSFFRCVRKNNTNFWQMVNLRGQKGERGEDGKFLVPLSVIQADAKRAHTCAVLEDSSIYCWGSNEKGQINPAKSGSIYDQKPEKLDFKGKKVAVGVWSTCAITLDNKVRCLGEQPKQGVNSDEEIQDRFIGDLHDVTDIAAGKLHFCAMAKSKQFSPGSDTVHQGLYCWGYNGFLQLGAPATTRLSGDPVYNAINVKSLALGSGVTCGIEQGTDGAFCFGKNTGYRMGLGENADTSERTLTWIGDEAQNSTKTPVKDISVSNDGICFIKKSDSKIYCAGQLKAGLVQLSKETTFKSFTEATEVLPSGNQAETVSLYGDTIIASATNRALYMRSNPGDEKLREPTGSSRNKTKLLSKSSRGVIQGERYVCEILFDNSLQCWGYNGSGRAALNERFTSSYIHNPKLINFPNKK